MPLIYLSPNISFCGIRPSSLQMFNSHISLSIDAARPHVLKGLDHELASNNYTNFQTLYAKSSVERIKEALFKTELSRSSYDTAWVAMVPSPETAQFPCFPKCVDWILNNQCPDGSWGMPHGIPSLIKDSLSSTLACILALRRWNVGEEQVRKGLHFIASNFSSTMDERLHAPIGFDIIFPGMVEYALDMGLDLSVRQSELDSVLCKRDLELKRSGNNSEGRKAYLAYIAEGLGKLQDWQEIMKYQRKNGSLFNSPSTTAAALIHLQNDKALNYLHSLIDIFGSSVPTVYPFDIYTQLSMVDKLETFGIAQHFRAEIKSILDRIYRCWVQNDEEIISDVSTCAMAFRLLRMNGYTISSDALQQLDEPADFYRSVQGHLGDTETVLELYKASQIKILANEQVLDKINSWSTRFLRGELSNDAILGRRVISEEVDYALKFPFYANLERLEHKRSIEHSHAENYRMLKTSYYACNVNNQDLLELAIEDFKSSQSTYRKELEHLESWIKENRLDQLKFARQKASYCYFSAAATLFSPELSDARICWAKNGVLTTVVDDFFDIGGSEEELLNLISLVEKWDGDHEKRFCSEQVKIVFSALYSTINELGDEASALQKRNVTNHIVNTWLSLMKSMLKDADWLRDNSVPSIEQYMENAYVSFALGPIILPALYFVGPEISEEMIRDPEYHNLYKLVSTCGRLLNDIQGFEREGQEGKLNSVSLRILQGHGSVTEEDVNLELKRVIESSRMELLRLVIRGEGSIVPRACKDLFWKMCQIVHLFYRQNDGFTSPSEMIGAVNAVIHQPLKVSRHLSSANPIEE